MVATRSADQIEHSLSPQRGEVKVRGEPAVVRPNFSAAWAIVLTASAQHFLDVARAPANPPQSFPGPSAGLAVENSRTAVSECCASSNKQRAPHPSPAALEKRVGCRPVPDCSALRRNKNPECAGPFRVVAGIYKPRSSGHAESPTIFSPPRWLFFVKLWRWRRPSSVAGLTNCLWPFKRWLAFSPLALKSLSPLRGEGSRRRPERVIASACREGNDRAVPPNPRAWRTKLSALHWHDMIAAQERSPSSPSS